MNATWPILVASLAVLAGCGAEQPGWSAQQAWTVEKQPAFEFRGSGSERVSAFWPVRVHDGQYLMAGSVYDSTLAATEYGLLLYDSTGRFLTRWGRTSNGAGDLKRVVLGAWSYRADSVAAYDYGENALGIFASNGSLGRRLTWARPNPQDEGNPYRRRGAVLGVFADGSVLLQSDGVLELDSLRSPDFFYHRLFLESPDGVTRDTIPILRFQQQLKTGGSVKMVPFGLRGIIAVGSDRWYYGTGEKFSIDVVGTDGRKIRKLHRDIPRALITDADKEMYIAYVASSLKDFKTGTPRPEQLKEAEQLRRTGYFPEKKPAYSGILLDSNENVWVEHYRFSSGFGDYPEEVGRWSVFDRNGKFLGEVETPLGVHLTGITRNHIIGYRRESLYVSHTYAYVLNKPRGM